MALAILRFQDTENDCHHFAVDLGKNRFYSYAIGDGKVQRINGLKVLKNRKATSPLIGPLPHSSLGRTRLAIPVEQFDRENQYVQITSYRMEDLTGPAISDVVRVFGTGAEKNLPSIAFSQEVAMNQQRVETVPFCYRESRNISSAMFLDTLTKLLPSVIPLLGGLLGGGSSGTKAAQNGSGSGQSPIDAQTINQLIQLVKKLAGGLSVESSRPVSIRVNGSDSVNQSRHHDSVSTLVRQTNYAEEMAIPVALLAALPGLLKVLGPVLQKVLDPKTLKALNPLETIGGLAHKGLELNSKDQQRLFDHLRQITPKTDTPEMDVLFQGLSLGLEDDTPPIVYKVVKSVRLELANRAPQMLNGRSRLLYQYDRDLAFPLTVETPRPIGRGILYLRLKDPETSTVLLQHQYPVSGVSTGQLSVLPKLTAGELKTLPINGEYLVCFDLVWQTRSKQKLGTNLSYLITLIGDYCFDRVGESSEPIALNDVDQFRPYWHKAWQGSFSQGLRRRTWDCKYYYTMEPEHTDNTRLETVTKVEESSRTRQRGKLKTGTILSPYRLNQLLDQISDRPQLEQAELSALLTSEFQERFHYAARTRVEFKGREGDSVALWIYPEFKLQQVILKSPVKTDAAGQVIEMTERTVHFPMPAIAHFIGVTSQS